MKAPHKSESDSSKRHSTRHRGITYRLRADGSKRYYVYSHGRQQVVEGGEREALTRQAELRSRVASGAHGPPANVRFKQVAEEWLAGKSKLRAKTRTDHRRALDLVLLPTLGRLRLVDVDANGIAAVIRGLEDKGLNWIDTSRPLRPLGASQINNYVTKPLSGIFKHAMRRGLTATNPVTLLTSDERPRDEQTERPYEWSPKSIRAVIGAARKRAGEPTSQYDYTLLVETAFGSGLRIGELCGLEWRDLDLDNGMLTVQRQFTNGEAVNYAKTAAGRRDVPISSQLVKKLRGHKVSSLYSLDDDVVFCSQSGGHLSAGNVRKRGWYPALEAAGLPRIRFHQARHAYASTLIAALLPVTTVSKVLGHADSTITLRVYAHCFDRVTSYEAVREAMTAALG